VNRYFQQHLFSKTRGVLMGSRAIANCANVFEIGNMMQSIEIK
jgi:hypothetical protein